MTSNIKPEEYIFRFGKFANMRAVDVLKIKRVNPKTGLEEAVGLKYLKFLVDKCDWFRDTEIIKQVIKNAEECISEDCISDEHKKDDTEIYHKKGEVKPKPKQEPKKKPMTKRINPFALSSDGEDDE